MTRESNSSASFEPGDFCLYEMCIRDRGGAEFGGTKDVQPKGY